MRRWAPALGLLLASCSAGYEVVVSFDSSEVRESAARIQVAVVSDCALVDYEGPLAASIRSVEFDAAEAAEPLGELPQGRYGLYARAWDEECGLVAAGCNDFEVEVGGEGRLFVTLAAASGAVCGPADSCVSARCQDSSDGGQDAGQDAPLFDGDSPDAPGCPEGEACSGGDGICFAGACCIGCVDGERCRVGRPVGICAPPEPPGNVLFIGNALTSMGDIPNQVAQLATSAGFDVAIDARTLDGESLGGHRADVSVGAAPMRVDEGWDVVVLQDRSLRPTSVGGDVEGFLQDSLWFHDRTLAARDEARVVLYEPWARHPDNEIYPDMFADAAQMQLEIRMAHEQAVYDYVPLNSTTNAYIDLAAVGDAWEAYLASPEARRLHADDNHRANAEGQYFSALVIYATLFETSTAGLTPAGSIGETVALELQQVVDAWTGFSALPPSQRPSAVELDDPIRIDFGTISSPWNQVVSMPANGRSAPLQTDAGRTTSVVVSTTGFDGTQNGGELMNTLGLPVEVARDTIWLGSFDGHEEALNSRGHVILRGLPAGVYTVQAFASRSGDDEGNGRLMRFEMDGTAVDYDAESNQTAVATFDGVRPSPSGVMELEVSVSPMGTGRFGYIGAMVLTKTE